MTSYTKHINILNSVFIVFGRVDLPLVTSADCWPCRLLACEIGEFVPGIVLLFLFVGFFCCFYKAPLKHLPFK